MTDKPVDNTPPGRLRAFYEWLTRAAPIPLSFPSAPPGESLPARIGHYAIARKIGEGGMGVVYAARDERLERTVALKTMASLDNDETARKRFWREARAAASVNHPNVCQIYEIGEDRGELFIAMELLEGEALAERLRRGALSVSQTLPVGLGIMAALSALHTRGIVHRDLKPSNVFLTPHGVKVLDFGLARPEMKRPLSTATELTRPGFVMGTPRYMAPEQVTGEAVDARSDLFAAGAILFEMLSGRPAFAGRTVLEILHATLHEQPPALTGSPALVAVDRVIRRALAKQPAERVASADAMAEELRAVRDVDGDDTLVPAHALARHGGPGPEKPRGGSPHRFTPPASPTRLVGRQQELAAACELLRHDDVRLVTCTGTAGVGKTRLALEVARAVTEDFADGVVFVALEAVRAPDQVLFEITKALQLREQDARASRQILVEYLEDKQLLLLLDNFEQVISAAPLLTNLLAACPRLKLLVTSRALLRLGAERPFPVQPLRSTTDTSPFHATDFGASGVALFLDRARLVRPGLDTTDETLETIGEICRRLDGLPLAIELAAVRSRVLTPKQLLARIDNRLEVLGVGMRDVAARQQTLRGAIDWSYELLPEPEKELLTRLSVFVGGATLDSVEAISANGGDGLNSLSSLVDNNLLRQTEDVEGNLRFSMLETIREYALERLEASGEANAIRSLHARHYLDLAEHVDARLRESEQSGWLDQLEVEYANCRTASEWFLSAGLVEEAFRVLLALWRFWEIRGYWSEGRMQFERLFSLTRQSASQALRARALYAAGVLADAQGDFPTARGLFQQHLAIQRAVGDPRAVASAINNLGVVAMRQGDYAAAEAFHLETLEIVRCSGLESSAAASLNNLGHVALYSGDHGRARSRYLESLELSQRSGNLRAVAWTLSNLADVSSEECDLAEAQAQYSQSLSLFQRIDDKAGEASCMADLGNLACRANDFELAASLYQESLVLFGHLGDKRGIVRVLEGFASLAAARHRPDATLRLAAVSAGVRKSLGTQAAASHQTTWAAMIDSARSMAGPEADRLWAEGVSMPFERAMQYALESAVSDASRGIQHATLHDPADPSASHARTVERDRTKGGRRLPGDAWSRVDPKSSDR